ncbi:unnamed protein product [Owenia fusiformis]|uniref:Cystic fibrosis transmembrane conductance regulator n=1 Tax=Owenia fusiformis TaxID=6347 RepID=A0A8J1Y2J4_OWEFU|nr:unnamed protein product [Owenia fusiformis]
MDESKQHVKPCPMTSVNPLSRLFFWWLNPLFNVGYKRPLEETDMFNVLPEDDSENLCHRLEVEWNKELEKVKKNEKESASLSWALIRTFGKQYGLLGLIAFIEELTKVCQPLLLGGLIRYFDPKANVTQTEAYLYAMGVSLCAINLAVVHHPYFFGVQRIGMQIRIACCSLMYKKTLRLSNQAMGQTTTGKIVNLMSNDVRRFDLSVLFFHFLWIAPAMAVVGLIIIWHLIGPSVLAGYLVLLLLIPVQGYMGKLFAKLRRKTAVETDERVKVMNEIITGMRVIKMYCWEKPFGALIAKIRSKEMKRIRFGYHVTGCILGPFWASGQVISFFTFMTYVLLGNHLTSEKIWVTIALLNPLRLVALLYVPYAVLLYAETNITIKRLETFLSQEEISENSAIQHEKQRPLPADCGIVAKDVTAQWDKELEAPTLSEIDFESKPGKLLAVIGPVGCGKSSLLMSILGEIPVQKGTIDVKGQIAYSAQQPWVFSASLRQNIIFGRKFEATRYNKILKMTALSKDISMLSEGDLTLVGERGVSLSGGQRARVSLARALYYEADVYLLDDPLSAVDAAVGKHLFEKCIQGLLKDKARILVTHQLQYLKHADEILILKDGKIANRGTFSDLAAAGIDFASLLKRTEDEKMAEKKQTNPELLDDIFKENLTAKTQSMFNLSHSKFGEKTEESISLLKKDAQQLDSLSLSGLRERIKSDSSLGPQSNHILENAQSNPLLMSTETLNFETDHVCRNEEEKRSEGGVTVGIYKQYFKAGGGVPAIIFLLFLCILTQVGYVMCDFWLSYWSNKEVEYNMKRSIQDENLTSIYTTNTTHNSTDSDIYTQPWLNISGGTENEITPVDRNYYLYIWSGITIGVLVFSMARALYFFHMLVNAAETLHKMMFKSIVRAPVYFFDTNPVGRILNRFSKDVGQMDEMLPRAFFDFVQCFFLIIGIIVVTGIINPWVFIPTLPLCVLFFVIRHYYLSTSRDVKRLEGTTRSPVFSHLSASIQGLHSIRAFKAEETFTHEFDKHHNLHTEAWFLYLATTRWFAIRLDFICALFITSVSFCSVLAAGSLNGGLVGLTMTYSMAMMGMFQWAVRQSAETETQMTSVERIIEYTHLQSEAELDSGPNSKPPSDWPKHGIITGEKASFKYSEEAPVVLKNLYFCVRAQEKVGIVGSTGAGKSSLISMLFRLAEPSGKLLIDGVSITEIGLHDLRGAMAIIPQDPVLFSGTIKHNLDPFNVHSDPDLWQALEEVELKSAVDELPGGLDSEISEGGTNFSVGQRQLLCLARAVLRRNKILIIDEATANVDPRTDQLIQQTIREKFVDCTVLTIAHRLNTVMDSERIMVLHDGCIKEFDEPQELLQNENSLFSEMVKSSGAEAGHLKQLAKEAFYKRHPNDSIEDNPASNSNINDVNSISNHSDKLQNNPSDEVEINDTISKDDLNDVVSPGDVNVNEIKASENAVKT